MAIPGNNGDAFTILTPVGSNLANGDFPSKKVV